MSRLLLFLGLAVPTFAKTVSLDWDIGWVSAAPDGYTRPVIGINGQWPLPILEADVGDTITINVKNSLGNETTGIHWHGQWQQGTPQQDGANAVSQCSIPPGGTFTYSFTAYPAGTFWYHSHDQGQYPDGLRAPMIIHDPQSGSPNPRFGCDEEKTLTVSDWYHEQMPYLINKFLDPSNVDGTMPMPDSSLINDAQSATYDIRPGQKLLFRIVNMSTLVNYFIQFEGHNMTVVAIDGVPVNPATWESLFIAPGQRYDIVITGLANSTKNYAFISKMDVVGYQNNGILRYNNAWPDPAPLNISNFNTGNDLTLTPVDQEPLLEPVTHSFTMDVNGVYIQDVGHRITLGEAPYIMPKVPSLYTTLSTGASASDPDIYGQVNAFVVEKDDIVEIVMNNKDGNNSHGHPMHLHGHVFQALLRENTNFDGNRGNVSRVPMKRDTVHTVVDGSLVIRFKADNPGVWLYHCHIDWHMDAGMSATFIEAPTEIQQTVTIPQQHLDICKAQGVPTTGNCAGNTRDLHDTASCHVYEKDPMGALVENNQTYTRRWNKMTRRAVTVSQ